MLHDHTDHVYLVFGKDSCPACDLAKGLLTDAKVKLVYFDLAEDSNSAISYIALLDATKTLIGRSVPPTIPQVYLCVTEDAVSSIDDVIKLLNDGKVTYIGGYRDLKALAESADAAKKF